MARVAGSAQVFAALLGWARCKDLSWRQESFTQMLKQVCDQARVVFQKDHCRLHEDQVRWASVATRRPARRLMFTCALQFATSLAV